MPLLRLLITHPTPAFPYTTLFRSSVANGLTWRQGDNIVTFRGEFPSNIYPWLRIRDVFGVEVRMCEERDGRVDFADLSKLVEDRKSTRLNSSHLVISYAVFCLKKK